MLDAGIKNLLARDSGLKIATVTFTDLTALLKEVSKKNPDIVVLSESNALDYIRTSEFLRGISPQKTLRVIVIRLQDNVLEIYDKRRPTMTRDRDLINFVKRR